VEKDRHEESILAFLLMVALVAVSYYNAIARISARNSAIRTATPKDREAAIQKARADSIQSAMSQAKGSMRFAQDSRAVAQCGGRFAHQTIAAKTRNWLSSGAPQLARVKNSDSGKSNRP